jgi:hypothetical protein
MFSLNNNNMITPEEKKEMLTIFRKHYDNLKMRYDIDNATLMLAILPAMQEYAKLNIPAVIHSLPEDATTCIICGEFEPHCKCKDGYKRQ